MSVKSDLTAVSSVRRATVGAGIGALAASLLASPSQAALVSACTGVSLPRSVVTDIISGPLTGVATPIQGTVNSLIGALTGLPLIGGVLNPLLPSPLSIDVTGLLTTAASGAPITLSVLDTSGVVVGPGAECRTTADAFELDTPAGISIGGNAITGLGSGADASAGTLGSIAFGNGASTSVAATDSIALGSGASVTAANSIAVGANSTATRGALTDYIAPGVTGEQNSVGEFSVGAPGAERQITNVAPGTQPTDAVNLAQVTNAINGVAAAVPIQYSNPGTPTTPNGGIPTNDVTLVGGAAGAVALHNVAPGVLASGSTDAVNGGQLFDTNAQVTTNTTNITANTTAIAGNTTAIAGNTTAITANTTSITNLNNGTAGVVRQVGGSPGSGTITVGAQTAGTLVDFTNSGSATRVLTGVTAGALNGTSTDAVNGSQLFTTNQNVTTNTTNIAGNTTAITSLTTNINGGTIGLVQQTGGSPGAGQITVGAATGGTSVSIAGTGGTRVLSGLSDGVVGSDAATVAQLASVSGGALNAVQYDVIGGTRQNSVTLVGGAAGPVEINNVADGTVAAASTDAVNGGQLFTTNTNVTNNATNISNLTNNINNGSVGLVRQVGGSPGAGLITVGAQTGGTTLSVAGTDGNRIISGVTAGVAATDAVNVSQLSAVGAGVANAVQYDTVGGVRQNSITLVGGAAGPVSLTNLSPGLLSAGSTDAVNGSQLFATNTGIGGAVNVLGGTFNVLTGAYTGPTYNTVGATTATTVQGAFDNYNTAIAGLTGGTAGLVQQAGPGAPITVGAATDGTVVNFTGTAGTRTLTGVTAGSLGAASTDAVNGSQVNALATSVANNLGGGATFNVVTGAISAPSYTVQGTAYNNAGSAFSAIDTALTNVSSGTVGPVQQTGAPNTLALVAPGGTGAAPGAAQALTNVAAVPLSATSTAAVNGSQLFATQTGIGDIVTVVGGTYNTTTGGYTGPTYNTVGGTTATTMQGAFNNYTTAIDNLTNGTSGLVQQVGGSPGTGLITVGAATGGTNLSIAGTGGTRVLSGLSDGVLGSDAATVAQLASVTGGALNAVQYDTVGGTRQNSITLVGGAAGPVTINNVANGTVAAGSTQAVNGGQLAATNTQVTNITNGTANAGAFRSDNTAGAAASAATGANSSAGGFGASATGTRSVALGNSSTSSGTNSVALGAGSTDGGVANVVSIGSVGAERRLTNVGPGTSGTDAINLSQLQAATSTFTTTTNGLQNQINQLDFDLSRAKRRANAGTAGALAIAGLPQPFTEGAGMVAGGVGYWQGQVAFAVGVSKIVSDSVIVKAGASVSGRGTAGGNAGVGFQF